MNSATVGGEKEDLMHKDFPNAHFIEGSLRDYHYDSLKMALRVWHTNPMDVQEIRLGREPLPPQFTDVLLVTIRSQGIYAATYRVYTGPQETYVELQEAEEIS